jgi:L-amino acid N-acyltransferase YncA
MTSYHGWVIQVPPSHRHRQALVRESCEQDLPAIAGIYAHHVTSGLASFEEVPPTVSELRTRRAAILDSHLPYLVAELDGEVVGYAYASGYRSRSAYRYTIEDSVYVANRLRGRGVGGALLAALLERCETGPWRQMLAVIGDSGNTASIALHRRYGFELVGTFTAVGFKLGRWVDTVLMQRALGSDARGAP